MNKLTRLKRCKRCISTLMLMCCSLLVWAQNTVTGTVLDESNLEVIGANVKEKGTANGAITDMNGVFHLKVSNLQKAVLQISFMGYEPQEVPLNGRKQLKIILKETANELQEVTVVAYGTQKKETLTGAISAVSNDALVRSPNASVANTLAGQITGLSSVQTSGQPGQEDPKVFIRGVGSLTESASSPLILVDGVERSFYQMDPNEIESVTVLKDASATAVFGVRGANGVILVTTRRGKEGKAKISVNSSVGIQMPTRMLEMADSYTYATLRNEIITNDKPNATENDLVFDNYAVERFRLNDDPIMYPSIDWRRYLLNTPLCLTELDSGVLAALEAEGEQVLRAPLSEELWFLWKDNLDENKPSAGWLDQMQRQMQTLGNELGAHSAFAEDAETLFLIADSALPNFSGGNGRYRYAKAVELSNRTNAVLTLAPRYENTAMILDMRGLHDACRAPLFQISLDNDWDETAWSRLRSFLYYC